MMDRMATRKIEHSADKGEFLTLDQLAAFVQDAMRSGASGDQHVHARVGWSGRLQQLRIEVDGASAAVEDKQL